MFVPSALAVTVCALNHKGGFKLTRIEKIWLFITIASILVVGAFICMGIFIAMLFNEMDTLRTEVKDSRTVYVNATTHELIELGCAIDHHKLDARCLSLEIGEERLKYKDSDLEWRINKLEEKVGITKEASENDQSSN